MSTKQPTNDNKSKNNKRSYKWPTLVVILLLTLVAGAGVGIKVYQDNQKNKIYSVGQTMKLSDFTATVTKATVTVVNLPVDKETVAKYGSLATYEDCDVLSKAPMPKSGYQSIFNTVDVPNPSPYNFCIRRNDSRKAIKDYSSENKQLTLSFTLKAKGTVKTKDVRIQVLPDSGRKLSTTVEHFNGNEFIYGNMEKDMNNVFDFKPYVPYFQSNLGGNVNPGLSRQGYLYTDVRNSENSADFSLSYWHNGKLVTKITRINLKG